MQFFPKKSAFKKHQKGLTPSNITRVRTLKDYSNNSVCLRSTGFGLLTSTNLASFFGTVKKYIKKRGSIVLFIYPQTVVTKKSGGVRMGKGKGSVCGWTAKVK